MSINVKQYGQPLLPDIVLSIVATVYIFPFAIDHPYYRCLDFELCNRLNVIRFVF